MDWQCYFEAKWNMPTKSDYYLAQIAQYVHATALGTEKPLKLSEFILECNEVEELSAYEEFKFEQRQLLMQKITMEQHKKG